MKALAAANRRKDEFPATLSQGIGLALVRSLADADALAAQIQEITYTRIGARDNGKCFGVQCDQHAQLRIGACVGKRSFSMKSGIGDVGL
jgi:hypothetical protein